MLKPFLMKLMKYENFSVKEIEQFFTALLQCDNAAQIATALALFQAKGETIEELRTLLQLIKNSMLSMKYDGTVLDIVGTGGDSSHTFNISTAACFLASACGVKVVKHGNRAVSSNCGAADILQQFGIDFKKAKENAINTLEQLNVAFCFAPLFHPVLKQFSDVRRQLNLPTFFNLLGPLLNPFMPMHLILGVKNKELMDKYIALIQELPIQRALIVHNAGMDEVSCVANNQIVEIRDKKITYFEINPEQYGLKICSLESLQSFSIEQSKEKFITALSKVNSPEAETIILNAALALYITDSCNSIAEGVLLAQKKIESGEAMELFKKYISCCASQPISVLKYDKTNFLEKIIEQKQQEILLLKQNYQSQKSFKSALKKDHLAVISEIKRHSPAKGFLSAISNPLEQTKQYIDGGADAISILTDETFFKGNKAEFSQVSQYYKEHPICFLQKDFILDRMQIVEAALLGANAVLLIARILKEKLADFIQFAKTFCLDALVEVHSLDELKLALESGAEIIGINNRDLSSFKTDWQHSLSLVDKIPNHIIKVSESAIDSVEKAQRLYESGFDAILVGEALVRSSDPSALIKNMKRKYTNAN